MRSVLKLALEGAPSEEFNASLRTLEVEEHAAMQARALSSTPVFDRSVVAFTAKAVVEVRKALQMVKSGCVNRALQDHLDACLSEDRKLKLAKVVTQKEQLDDFLKIRKEQGAEWQEQLRAKQKEASEKAAESKEKFEGFLVPLGKSHWAEWLKKVPAGEVLEAELKKLTKAEKALSALEASAPIDTEDLKMQAKAQIHWWGMATLLGKPGSIGAAGQKARQALGEIWKASQDDEALRKLVPEALAKEVEAKLVEPQVAEDEVEEPAEGAKRGATKAAAHKHSKKSKKATEA